MKELSSTICRWCTTSWAWCAKSAFTVPWSHLRPSGTMAGRAASHLWKEVLTNHLHPLNCLLVPTSSDSWGSLYKVQTQDASHTQGMLTASNTQTHMGDWTKDLTSVKPTHAYHLYLLAFCLGSRCENEGGLDIHQTNVCTSSKSSCMSLRLQSGKNWHMHIISSSCLSL